MSEKKKTLHQRMETQETSMTEMQPIKEILDWLLSSTCRVRSAHAFSVTKQIGLLMVNALEMIQFPKLS
jgi:hypothetical protein